MKINVMDVETLEENGTVIPYCICLLLENRIYSFWYSSTLVTDFLEKISHICNNKEVCIFTHNINFDGLLILDGIKNKNIVYDLFIRENNIYWIKIHYLLTIIIIRCSYKIIPISVENIGKMIGCNKTIFPYKFVNLSNLNYLGEIPDKNFFNSDEDYHNFKLNNNVFDLKKKSIEYCINDVNIVHIILNEIFTIFKEIKCDKMIKNSYSFSALAYKVYIKKYDQWGIKTNKNKIIYHEYIKNAYYGGRCEVFGNPSNNQIIHHFDFSGMYAQCMREKFPIGGTYISNTNLSIYNTGFHTIRYRCNHYLPYLPTRNKKLVFPNGEIVGTYWCEEIWNAIKNLRCDIVDHYSSLIYENSAHIFAEYIDIFSKLRKKGMYYNFFGKNMCNGLYGSFALEEKNEIYVVCLNETELQSYYELTDVIGCINYGNTYILKIEKSSKSKKILDKKLKWDLEHKKRNIAYAAIIASKARIKLNNALNDVLNDGGELYYTDTDSIFAGYSKSKLNHKLNDITWTDAYEDAVFVSSKFYFIKGKKLKIKGINNSKYSYEELKNDFFNNKKLWVFENQLNFEKKNLILEQKYMTKKIILSSYDKRIFDSNKINTIPIEICMNKNQN